MYRATKKKKSQTSYLMQKPLRGERRRPDKWTLTWTLKGEELSRITATLPCGSFPSTSSHLDSKTAPANQPGEPLCESWRQTKEEHVCVERGARVSFRHPWMPSQGFPPETDCNACSAHSCTRSNTQVQCKATLKARRAHAFLVQKYLIHDGAVRA